ncbi:MAG: tRNA lysidine(34) synthetase TilS [Candidatus Saccharibacteria bacterium]|nr:tRNA lysidine(34) synthetase TilS [Candidatus Saccharibacteria bacterium]
MNYIVAVSGGVDSVVLLHQLVRAGRHRLVVAHVNHGMRPEADADARFVAGLAEYYGLPYEEHRAALGEAASEEVARQARYDFLFAMAQRHDARVVTAHHADDVVETVALNLRRGTRWRGLAAMSDERIARPLLSWTKQQIYEYAMDHHLEWVEDATNYSDKYVRNQLRRRLFRECTPAQRDAVVALWRQQCVLKKQITRECDRLQSLAMSRYGMSQIDLVTAGELLHRFVWQQTGVSLMAGQLERGVMALRTGRVGTTWQLARGVEMKLSLKSGIIKRVD